MTERLYQLDSYLKAFDAVVMAVDKEQAAIELDRTAFYPGGGGQPYDRGTLSWDGGSNSVVKMSGHGQVLHFLEGALPSIGTLVHGEIDWPLRFDHMRTHTAMHILCGVVWRDYGAQVTGGNMTPRQGRMDFEFENLSKELVAEIEEKVNIEVQADRPIRVAIHSRKEAFAIPDLIRTKINLLPEGIEQIRTVEIVGLDLQADGGTHVSSTAQVGPITIVGYKSKGRINKRIEVALDEVQLEGQK